MTPRRRALVLTDEAARHPFLRSLPPNVRAGVEPKRTGMKRWRVEASDWRDFFFAYCACFVMVTTFIN